MLKRAAGSQHVISPPASLRASTSWLQPLAVKRLGSMGPATASGPARRWLLLPRGTQAPNLQSPKLGSSAALFMSPERKRFVLGVICVVLGAHYVAIVARLDHWPLSNYAMFARRREASVSSLVLMGVTAQGDEVRLQSNNYWQPYKSTKLAFCLREAKNQDARRARSAVGSPPEPTLPTAVKSLLAHYESRRQAGQHRGPPLAGLRLYDVTWRIEPTLGNLDRPDRQELLCEHLSRH